MLDIDSPAKRKRVSTPASALDSGAFGADAYNPKAYGAMSGPDPAPRFPRRQPTPSKSLSELTEDAQVRLFVARKGLFGLSLRTTAMLAAGLLVVASTISTAIVLSSDNPETPSQPEVSASASPAAIPVGARAKAADSQPSENDFENIADVKVTDAGSREPVRPDTDFKPSGLLDASPAADTVVAEQGAPVDDPRPARVSAAPRATQSPEADRSARYRNLRTALKRDLASLRIVDAAATARALAALNEPMDWEAHRWAARALRLNGNLEEAAQLYALYAKLFPTNRYSARAKLWVQSLRRRIDQDNESASRALDNENPAQDAVTEQTVSVITNK